MMSSNYNSRFRPAEILFYKAITSIRKRETIDDILSNQVEIEVKTYLGILQNK